MCTQTLKRKYLWYNFTKSFFSLYNFSSLIKALHFHNSLYCTGHRERFTWKEKKHSRSCVTLFLFLFSVPAALCSGGTSFFFLPFFIWDNVKSPDIIWRPVSVRVCSLALLNRGAVCFISGPLCFLRGTWMMHFWCGFLLRKITSPSVQRRHWLKSLVWLRELCQWDTWPWSGSLWSWMCSTGAHK